MSRSGYSDCDDYDALAAGRWRQAVRRAVEGKRGQALLQELAEALDAMPDKRLYSGSFATPEGAFCTLGVLGAKRGTKMDDLGDDEDCDPALVGERFGIAYSMAAEIMYLNDEYLVEEWEWVEEEFCGPVRRGYPDFGSHKRTVRVYNNDHARKRWEKMRAWVEESLSRHSGCFNTKEKS